MDSLFKEWTSCLASRPLPIGYEYYKNDGKKKLEKSDIYIFLCFSETISYSTRSMSMKQQNHAFERVQAAIDDLQAGKMVIMVDDEDRENEGDLVVAAEFATPEVINFMAKEARGLICLSLTSQQIDKLDLPMMTSKNGSRFQTAFTLSIEAREGVTTGISAFDRSHTILTAIKNDVSAQDIVTPGHVFPLKARDGGVLVRAGQTEGSVDLAKLAGLQPSAVICEVMKDDGTMARRPDLEEFSKTHDLKIVSVADIIQYRLRHEQLINREVETTLPTEFGEFRIQVYSNAVDSYQHVAMIFGDLENSESALVRVHSECLTGDIFGSKRCDCGPQLHAALRQISEAGAGVLLYIRQEGRGIGLVNKLKAYNLQDEGHDTVTANEKLGFKPDLRDYGIGAQVLASLGLKQLKLLTNNPKKIVGLEGHGLEVIERVPLEVEPAPENASYLETKKTKMGHLLKKV